jgi:hypothetical protein
MAEAAIGGLLAGVFLRFFIVTLGRIGRDTQGNRKGV